MNDEQLKEKQLDSEVIFDGNLLHIRRDRVQLPDGGTAVLQDDLREIRLVSDAVTAPNR